MSVLLDSAAKFANLDPGYIAETLSRQITASFTQAPQLFKDIAYFTSFNEESLVDINYYEAGTSAGKLIKIFLDFTVDN